MTDDRHVPSSRKLSQVRGVGGDPMERGVLGSAHSHLGLYCRSEERCRAENRTQRCAVTQPHGAVTH